VGGHIDSTDVVAVDNRRRRNGCMELLEQLTKPTSLSNSVRNNTILSLRTRTRDRSLSFGGPRDQVVTEEDAVARSGAPRVRATSPISIGVGGQTVDAANANVKPSRQSTLHIS